MGIKAVFEKLWKNKKESIAPEPKKDLPPMKPSKEKRDYFMWMVKKAMEKKAPKKKNRQRAKRGGLSLREWEKQNGKQWVR